MKNKIRIVLAIVLILIFSSNIVFADAPDPATFTGSNTGDLTKVNNLGNQIITIISTIASIISVIVLIVLGIKYMMGSAEEKAEYKKTLIPYIIGASLVFAASSIASMVFQVSKDFLK